MRTYYAIAALSLAAALAGCSAGSITVPRYVLSYGISDYADDGDLNSPADDAQFMRSLLVADGYTALQTAACTDSAVTKSQIQSDISSLASLESDSIIVIFYASHGTYFESGSYAGYEGAYLVPYDAINADGSGVLTNLISPTELSGWISQSGKRNVIVILNTCFSGGFVDSGSSIDTAPQNYGPYDDGTTPSGLWTAIENFGTLLSKNASDSEAPGPIVISAAGSEEVTYELTSAYSYIFDDHGIFPYFIIKAAESGDANGDGYVTATEAYAYAVSGIKSNWNVYYQGEYDSETGTYADFMPHISGGARDLVLYSN